MRNFPKLVFVSVITLGLAGSFCSPLACEMDVREAGFLNNAGGPYRPQQYTVALLFAGDTPEVKNSLEQIKTVCAESLQESNLDVRPFIVDKLSDAMRKEMESYKINLSVVPSAVLLRERQYDMEVAQTIPGFLKEADLRSLLTSPKRKELTSILSDNSNHCVIMLLAGLDKSANAKALKAITTTLTEHKKYRPEQNIPVFTVDRSAPEERLFLAELVPAGEPKEPIAAVLFGKGRIVLPILTGQDITVEKFHAKLGFVNYNASDCTPDAVLVPGSVADMILPWSAKLDMKMFEAIAKSGAVPDLMWDEAEVDPETGEMMASPAPQSAPGAPEPAASASVSPAPTPGAPAAAPARPPAEAAKTPAPLSPTSEDPPPTWVYVFPIAIGLLLVVMAVSWVVLFKRK